MKHRLSAVYAKTNSEYILTNKKKHIYNSNNKEYDHEYDYLNSGRLLDNVVMYLNYRETERQTTVKIIDTTPTLQDTETVISIITSIDSYEQDLLNGKLVKERILNSVDTLNNDGIKWFHCMTRSSFRSVLELMKVQHPATNILLSTVPKSNIIRQNDGSILLILVSLTLDDTKNVNMDQVSIYIQDNIVISFECLTSGNIIPDNMLNLVKNSHLNKSSEKTVDLPQETLKFEEFDPTLSREYYVRLFIDEFASTHIFFNEMKTILKQKFIRPIAKPTKTDSRQLVLPKLPSFRSNSSIASCPQDISYFIYESIHIMLNISTPVLNVYLAHQKELSIHLMFSSSQNTTHSNEIKNEILTLRSGLNLISNLIERTFLCLKTNTSLLTSLLALRPEYTTEILDNYSITFSLVQKLQLQSEQLYDKIVAYEKKKSQQISTALSMSSVFFFPIGFLASVYGQNFSNNGTILWMYESKYGTYIFVALNCFVLLFTIIVIFYKGWGDTLGELHVVGKVILSNTMTWWSKLFQHSGVKMTKEEIELMISSRKGTKSNKLAMHINTRRYQKRYGEGVGGDRLRNFSI